MNYLEMVSRLGLGSAHPGGFTATIDQLNRYQPITNEAILEIGCGTGRTACYLANKGYQVIAIDINPDNLDKAKKRAKEMGLHVDFLLADAHALPFPDETFEIILVESVTNFTQAKQSLTEYYRVLKPGGILYDREMFVRYSVPSETLSDFQSFFQMPSMMRKDEWSSLLTASGFVQIEFLEISDLNDEKLGQQFEYPDDYQFIDEGVLLDNEIMECAIRSSNMIIDNKEYLEFGIMRATKG
ncbi:class I SAM-dependent methyltransferase [Paenibacillus rigui]|uniref:Methyltransferase type 11 n=1 Tax=Paenibacillus rigui TaxID=554312 RepID=A0A229UJI8_9BACL|nr:class I SAM-dependent methyltransferase [Paenibacillus rigui]OXM83059.1 methyltransferase type 11 [Paenibacillus rigui]